MAPLHTWGRLLRGLIPLFQNLSLFCLSCRLRFQKGLPLQRFRPCCRCRRRQHLAAPLGQEGGHAAGLGELRVLAQDGGRRPPDPRLEGGQEVRDARQQIAEEPVEGLSVFPEVKRADAADYRGGGAAIELVSRHPTGRRLRLRRAVLHLQAQFFLGPFRAEAAPPGLPLGLRESEAVQMVHDVGQEGGMVGEEEAGVGELVGKAPALAEEGARGAGGAARAQDEQHLLGHGFQALQASRGYLVPEHGRCSHLSSSKKRSGRETTQCIDMTGTMYSQNKCKKALN